MGRIFGTDGARGVANTELSCELAMQIGRAAAVVLTAHNTERPRVIIGRDTRVSSEMLGSALIAGICSMGADAEILGVVPTPAVAYLVDLYKADAGVMISASHNPMEYNGIKLFSKDGYKLSDEIEEEIEALIHSNLQGVPIKTGADIGRIYHNDNAAQDYVQYLKTTIDRDLRGIKVAIDCANGSASATARLLFDELGADALIINDVPDGKNINLNCGSTHIEELAEFTKNHNCKLGIAFDGDADRCLAVDENGEFVDGDQLMGIFARHMMSNHTLADDTVVVTVMSNLGFLHFARREEIQTVITGVGDRYVLDKMLEGGYSLGGEQSGHIILSQYGKTGDGQLTAIQLLSIVKQYDLPFSTLAAEIKRYPQILHNIRVTPSGMKRVEDSAQVNEFIAKHAAELGDDGRILVRASGTEPLIRIMAEGKDYDRIKRIVEDIGKLIKSEM
ncbi:MAG: phosphoglucosamine mutase [Oscillospiraceae bacterium]|nr:phosphoglucosamine mutase [Oscillospiraceae bacterium]